MTVQELIDKLKYFDKNTKVLGVKDVKSDTIPIVKYHPTDYDLSVREEGFETVVKII